MVELKSASILAMAMIILVLTAVNERSSISIIPWLFTLIILIR